jgi:uncharacterized iron-regulated membrane protein
LAQKSGGRPIVGRPSLPLHFGDYGGIRFKTIWALLDLITLVVLLSGLYLCWKKQTLSVEPLLAEADLGGGIALSQAQGAVSR